MVVSLDKKWKELLFGASGFGPNFLMVLMGAYYTDALNPVALGNTETLQAIMSGTCFILPALFPILYAIGKVFDGVIDIPFAHITDTLSTRWGRRRPPILVSFFPMALSYAMCWIPVGGPDGQLLNTIWVFFWSLVFFAAYTMSLISFYGSLSSTCNGESQRVRVAGYKSFFDTINYCIVYALVPLLLELTGLSIDRFALVCLPLSLTILIPVFLIKEGKKYGYPELECQSDEKISLVRSVGLTFRNRVYMKWILVNCCTTFGLQMFLVGMNAMIIGGMGFNGAQMALVNTCAFAPVPIMLYLFNKMKSRCGVRVTYQTCLMAFAIGMLSFFFASTYFIGDNKPVQMVISAVGGVIGSWGIGTFFMMPYLAASQISEVETRLTGINHSAMYFAADAVTSSIVGAVSGSLVYENIKMLFISKTSSGIVYASSIQDAAEKLSSDVSAVYNFGTLLVPFIVTFFCLIGIALCRKLPRDFSVACIAEDYKKYNPSLDISSAVASQDSTAQKGEYVLVQEALSILSGFIFGFIWTAFLLKGLGEATGKKKRTGWLLCCLVPFAGGFVMAGELDGLKAAGKKELAGSRALLIISGIVLPIMPLNLIALGVMQHNLNRFYGEE